MRHVTHSSTRFGLLGACLLWLVMVGPGMAQPYYVATNGFDGAVGTAWTSAFRTISEAIATASGGDTIWISNGTFLVTEQISLTKGITVRSTNGAAMTTVAGSGGNTIFYINNASAVVQGLTVTNGYGIGNAGAGVYLVNGTLRDCVITKNKTWGNMNGSSYGSGIYQTGGLVERCTISSNWTEASKNYGGLGYGGGIYQTAGTIRNCRIFGNSAKSSYSYQNGRGGGIYMASPGGTVENSLIYRNEGPGFGGGIAMVGAAARVINCTISANTSWNHTGAGLYQSAGAVTNTIIYHNTRVLDGYHVNVSKTGGSMGYSCSTPSVAGPNNVSAEPDFMNRTADDFHLRPGSVCLDAGTNLTTITTDLNNTGRPLNGDGIGAARHDLGAFEEAVPTNRPFTANFTAPVHDGVDTLTVVFTAAASGNTNGLYYRWDFTSDGTNDAWGSTKPTVTNGYGPGYHTVSLVISNGAGAVTSVVKTAYVRVLGSTNYVSSTGGHVFPYVTWAGASTSVYAAVNAAIDGGVVRVTNGAYSAWDVQLSRGILLRGVNGAANTVISGGNRILMAHSNAVMERLTVTGTRGIAMTAGTIRDCILEDNYLPSTEGGAGIRMTSGLIERCIIRRNRTYGNANAWSYGGGLYLTGGRVQNCLIAANEATTNPGYGGASRGGGVYLSGSAILENCTISGNSVNNSTYPPGSEGAGIYRAGGTVTNTIIWDNTNVTTAANSDISGTWTNGFSWSCSPGLSSGTGNITDDPLFVTAGTGHGYSGTPGDYHLQPFSPCENAGLNMAWMTDAIDLDGKQRRYLTVAIGAYEESATPGIVIILR